MHIECSRRNFIMSIVFLILFWNGCAHKALLPEEELVKFKQKYLQQEEIKFTVEIDINRYGSIVLARSIAPNQGVNKAALQMHKIKIEAVNIFGRLYPEYSNSYGEKNITGSGNTSTKKVGDKGPFSGDMTYSIDNIREKRATLEVVITIKNYKVALLKALKGTLLEMIFEGDEDKVEKFMEALEE